MPELPDQFIKNILSLYPQEAGSFFEALLQPVHASIRLNPKKPAPIPAGSTPVEWCADGYYLAERPSFISDPLFHAGAYYVQESSSMFLEHILRQLPIINEPIVALDLCAAPGGKSTLLQAAIHPHSTLISNEIIKTRVPVLIENMLRWGYPNQIITNNDPKQIGALTALADLILVDAPCSGEGLFRKDPQAMNEWSMDNVMLCVARQKRILGEILPALKPGGYLVYSTCTFNHFENEDTVKWLIDEQGLIPVDITVADSWPVVKADNTFKFLPHRVKGEGLFFAVFRKPQKELSHENKFKEPKLNFVSRKLFPQLNDWLSTPESFDFITENELMIALPKTMLGVFSTVREKLYVKYAGICMGKFDKKGNLIPEHDLALSTFLSPAVPAVNVDRESALLFLKKGNLELQEKYPEGWYVLRYQGLALGWIKVLANRVNNYLPAAYRIIKDLG